MNSPMASLPTSREDCDRLVSLSERIQRPVNKSDLGSLVLALTARDADIMGRKLNTLVEEIRAIDKKVTAHPKQEQLSPAILERIGELEKDAKSSKNILKEIQQKDTQSGAAQIQLDFQLFDALKLHLADIAELNRRYKSLVRHCKRSYGKQHPGPVT